MSEAHKASLLRRLFVGGAWMMTVAVLLVAAVAFWLLATASGAQFVLERAAALAGGRVAGVEGRLAGPLAVGAIEVDMPEASPARGARFARLVAVAAPRKQKCASRAARRLARDRHGVHGRAAREPASLALRAPPRRACRGDRLRVGTIGDESGGVVLRDVSLKLAADRVAWILVGGAGRHAHRPREVSGTLGRARRFPGREGGARRDEERSRPTA